MIPIDKLRGIKRLITHASCPDGCASALIVRDALPDVEVEFMAHGTEEHRLLEPAPGMLFCDFTPHIPARLTIMEDGATKNLLDGHALSKWIEAGVLVLDHHPTQRDITDNFARNGLGAYGENDRGECGAWLAYEHVWNRLATRCGVVGITDEADDRRERAVREFAELAGVRDTWKKNDPRWQAACEQAEALMFWGFDKITLGNMLDFEQWRRLGTHLFEKKLESARKAIDESHSFWTDRGTRVLVFQGVTSTSDAAEILEQLHQPLENFASTPDEKCLAKFMQAYRLPFKQPDIVVGFHYRVDGGKLKLQFSTRSHTGYDVGAFCKARGGGGHRGAAGFTVEQSAEVGANPYAVFRLLLEEYEVG